MPDFATRVRELRKERGLRQRDLADAFGTAQTTIANYENKLRFPDESMLGRLAEYFDVSLDYLLGRSNVKRKTQDWVSRNEEIPEQPFSASSDAARYLGLVRQGDSDGAAQLVERLSRGALGIRRTYLDVLEPALKEVGRLWAHGELSVAEEHVISQATERIMSRVYSLEGTPREATGEAVCCVLAVSSEQHLIGPRMVSDFLRLDGWNVQFLGGNLGIGHLLEVLAARPVNLLAISVTSAGNVAEAADLIATVREKDFLRATRVIVGGQAFHSRRDLWEEIGADGTGRDAESAVMTANKLVRPGPPSMTGA
jgi:methanogenic corrinoid protein MtbC1/DNA-binding XRE family transcriptional regulator